MTWEVGPREMMRCLHTDNITINIMNNHNTAMFIVDQETSPLRTEGKKALNLMIEGFLVLLLHKQRER